MLENIKSTPDVWSVITQQCRWQTDSEVDFAPRHCQKVSFFKSPTRKWKRFTICWLSAQETTKKNHSFVHISFSFPCTAMYSDLTTLFCGFFIKLPSKVTTGNSASSLFKRKTPLTSSYSFSLSLLVLSLAPTPPPGVRVCVCASDAVTRLHTFTVKSNHRRYRAESTHLMPLCVESGSCQCPGDSQREYKLFTRRSAASRLL